jgi:hypothetical protein
MMAGLISSKPLTPKPLIYNITHLQQADQMHCRGAVQATGGLVKQDDGRVDQQLVANGHALALTATDASPEKAPCRGEPAQQAAAATHATIFQLYQPRVYALDTAAAILATNPYQVRM